MTCLETDRFACIFWETHELFPKIRERSGIAVKIGMCLNIRPDYIYIKRAVPI